MAKDKIKYFPVYLSYSKTLSGLTDEQFGRVIRAALQYTETGETPDLDALEALSFQFLKNDLERLEEHHQSVSEGRKNAVNKRWEKHRQEKAQSENSPVHENNNDTNEYKQIQNVQDDTKYSMEKEKEKEKENIRENTPPKGGVKESADALSPTPPQGEEKSPPKSRKRTEKTAAFVPPTREEVEDYCAEAGISIDVDSFIDHFTENGWLVGGKTKMRDWKAAVRNWYRRDKKWSQSARDRPANSGKPDEQSFGDFLEDVIAGRA